MLWPFRIWTSLRCDYLVPHISVDHVSGHYCIWLGHFNKPTCCAETTLSLSLCVSHSRFITTLSVCLLLESDPPDLIIWFAPSLSPSLPVRSQLIPRRGSIMMSALKSESVLFVAKANMQTKLRCNLCMPFRIRITRIMHAFWYPTLN